MARGSPPPIMFEPQVLHQQTILHRKGNLMAGRIHLNIEEMFRFHDFMSNFHENDSRMAV